jgi:hypothetical protein
MPSSGVAIDSTKIYIESVPCIFFSLSYLTSLILDFYYHLELTPKSLELIKGGVMASGVTSSHTHLRLELYFVLFSSYFVGDKKKKNWIKSTNLQVRSVVFVKCWNETVVGWNAPRPQTRTWAPRAKKKEGKKEVALPTFLDSYLLPSKEIRTKWRSTSVTIASTFISPRWNLPSSKWPHLNNSGISSCY